MSRLLTLEKLSNVQGALQPERLGELTHGGGLQVRNCLPANGKPKKTDGKIMGSVGNDRKYWHRVP